MDIKNYNDMLRSMVKYNVNVCGLKQTERALKLYIDSNNVNGFTDKNLVRINLTKIPNFVVRQLVGNDINGYVKQFAKQEEKVVQNNLTNDEIAQIVVHALKVTINKIREENKQFTEEQLYNYVIEFTKRLAKNNCQMIPEENNLRAQVKLALAGKNIFDFNNIMAEYLYKQGIEIVYISEMEEALANIILDKKQENKMKFN